MYWIINTTALCNTRISLSVPIGQALFAKSFSDESLLKEDHHDYKYPCNTRSALFTNFSPYNPVVVNVVTGA